jgi:hypothetical protein
MKNDAVSVGSPVNDVGLPGSVSLRMIALRRFKRVQIMLLRVVTKICFFVAWLIRSMSFRVSELVNWGSGAMQNYVSPSKTERK